MDASGFDWDDGNRVKCQAHGVTIPEIEGLFRRPIRVAPDPAHSVREERFKAIGSTISGRMVFVVFTMRRLRNVAVIRPISARYMHRKEVAHYEKEATKADK